MSHETVDVYVTNKSTGLPVEGVVLRAYDEEGKVFYASSTTDAQGHAGFLLWTRKYTLRFYKFSWDFEQPVHFEVVSGQNVFDIAGNPINPSTSAIDPRLCRASGYFRDITGAPRPYLDIIFIGQFAPLLVDGAGVLSERRMIKTDKDGYACVDLIRCAKYGATVENMEDVVRDIAVPDAPSVNLPDLLFPTADSISYEPPSPWTLSAGSTLELTPTVRTSSGVILDGTSTSNVQYSTEDPSIATVVPATGTTLVLRGIAPGTTKLLVKRTDLSVIEIPFTDELTGSGLPIVVQ